MLLRHKLYSKMVKQLDKFDILCYNKIAFRRKFRFCPMFLLSRYLIVAARLLFYFCFVCSSCFRRTVIVVTFLILAIKSPLDFLPLFCYNKNEQGRRRGITARVLFTLPSALRFSAGGFFSCSLSPSIFVCLAFGLLI